MRIISGKYKSRRFKIPKNFKARPTTDFAKENIFNVVVNLLEIEESSALDLFAGTGSIGFEFLSRGCSEVICVELDAGHHSFINKVKNELKTEQLIAVRTDAMRYITTANRKFDFIFADPPYLFGQISQIPEHILSHKLLNRPGIFIMEHPKEYDFSHLPGFFQRRVYGAVNFSIFMANQ